MGKQAKRFWGPMMVASVLMVSGCSDDGGGSSGGVGGGEPGGSSSQGGTSGQGSGGTKPTDPCGDCAGCCDGSTCLPLASQNKLSCGKGGDQCATCGDGKTCSAGACVVDASVCSPLSCKGCCAGGLCRTDLSWTSCGKGGTTCQTCEPMALCTTEATCENDQWGKDALLDIYIEQFQVLKTKCSDPTSAPDPRLIVSFGGKTYTSSTCQDSENCVLTPPWKIANVPYQQLLFGSVALSAEDVDEVVNASCWKGAMPLPARDFSSKVYFAESGAVFYHVRPAGY